MLAEVDNFACVCLGMCLCTGKKQDLWYVVDLLTGEKQQTLTSSFAEMLCPSSSLLYLGRTGKNTTSPNLGSLILVASALQQSITDLIWLINRPICFACSYQKVLANPYLPTAHLYCYPRPRLNKISP